MYILCTILRICRSVDRRYTICLTTVGFEWKMLALYKQLIRDRHLVPDLFRVKFVHSCHVD